MRLQLLGDSPDAFKWDLVHWLCTRSAPVYSRLLFVPMLTPDISGSTEGRTPHERFDCRPEIRDFLVALSTKRTLEAVRGLGSIDPKRRFEVAILPPADRYVGHGVARAQYWAGWSLEGLLNALVFLDPDTGFETKTQRDDKWVRHAEVERILHALPDSGGTIIYQHRPRFERWGSVFDKLRSRLGYAAFAAAVFEANVAFVILARTDEAAKRLDTAAKAYVANRSSVEYQVLDLRRGQAIRSPPPPPSQTPRRAAHVCECGCGGSTQRRFVPGHDSILRAWVIRVERGVIGLDEIPHQGIRASVARVLRRALD
jgi:hypothetical protein